MDRNKKPLTFALATEKRGTPVNQRLQHNDGVIAQLVEQRTENPCVPGSIPGDTTQKKTQVIDYQLFGFFLSSTPTQSCRQLAGNLYSEIDFIYI